MFTVTEYSVVLVKDPFKILAGTRYEFKLDLNIEEDDELYSEHGIYVKAIYKVEEEQGSVVNYDLIEKSTDRYLDFDMEAEEEEALAAFCKEHYSEA
ncbi:DUF6509 family protein [Cohnella abietis]|uniref:Pullulanase n=1 Tax=Cohnella abietis TaxID=2507935 RepID=A0A3T1DE56_9BACL|nr:DUF6509 family protein [Cohnella abietis]BBI36387.1 hypothetical protein KCTCHS21_57860 [Cohnella abietis]